MSRYNYNYNYDDDEEEEEKYSNLFNFNNNVKHYHNLTQTGTFVLEEEIPSQEDDDTEEDEDMMNTPNYDLLEDTEEDEQEDEYITSMEDDYGNTEENVYMMNLTRSEDNVVFVKPSHKSTKNRLLNCTKSTSLQEYKIQQITQQEGFFINMNSNNNENSRFVDDNFFDNGSPPISNIVLCNENNDTSPYRTPPNQCLIKRSISLPAGTNLKRKLFGQSKKTNSESKIHVPFQNSLENHLQRQQQQQQQQQQEEEEQYNEMMQQQNLSNFLIMQHQQQQQQQQERLQIRQQRPLVRQQRFSNFNCFNNNNDIEEDKPHVFAYNNFRYPTPEKKAPPKPLYALKNDQMSIQQRASITRKQQRIIQSKSCQNKENPTNLPNGKYGNMKKRGKKVLNNSNHHRRKSISKSEDNLSLDNKAVYETANGVPLTKKQKRVLTRSTSSVYSNDFNIQLFDTDCYKTINHARPKFHSMSSAPQTKREKLSSKDPLPTIRGSVECTCISGQTLVNLMKNEYSEHIDKYYIIDCRYKYEYEGGHIRGAYSVIPSNAEEKLHDYFIKDPLPNSHRVAIVFHCEFSSKRGPECYRLLRQLDRTFNTYPNLHYPHLYLIEGGYSEFHQHFPQYCGNYIKMYDNKYTSQLRSAKKAHSKAKKKREGKRSKAL